MPSGQPPLNAETKARNRKESLQRYAAKSASQDLILQCQSHRRPQESRFVASGCTGTDEIVRGSHTRLYGPLSRTMATLCRLRFTNSAATTPAGGIPESRLWLNIETSTSPAVQIYPTSFIVNNLAGTETRFGRQIPSVEQSTLLIPSVFPSLI
jgi:hypothetical protein